MQERPPLCWQTFKQPPTAPLPRHRTLGNRKKGENQLFPLWRAIHTTQVLSLCTRYFVEKIRSRCTRRNEMPVLNDRTEKELTLLYWSWKRHNCKLFFKIVSPVVNGACHEDRNKAPKPSTGLKQARRKARAPWQSRFRPAKEPSALENYLYRFDLP